MVGGLFFMSGCRDHEPVRALVFTAAEDFRHGSTAAGVQALRSIGEEIGVEIDVADSAGALTEPNLKKYRAVIFLNTSGDVLDYGQQADFERFIQAGGGFVGIHGAAETETEWDWFGRLVGAYFDEPFSEYPRITLGIIRTSDAYAGTDSIPASWNHADEWYRFTAVNADVEVLLHLEWEDLEQEDLEQEEPGREDDEQVDHSGGREPISWRHAFDGGRAFYTAIGHNPEAFRDAAFRAHLRDGLEYALGDRRELEYANATTVRMPEENRFMRTILADSLDEPTELTPLGDGKVLFVERKGAVKLYDPAADSVRTIARFDVHTEFEDGLMGVALDPDFARNHRIYFYYSPAGDEPRQHLSRFELRDDSLLMDSEVVMLIVPTQRDECCHTGGSVEFGPDGNLFLSTGDDTNPFESDGFAPIDERPGRSPFDAQGTSANSNDLRGKILRITPRPDGSYTVPAGNLFEPGTPGARPEIFVMGNRNPYRISIDQKTGYLYWGEVGPDAGEDDWDRGPRGHDEINQARGAGFFGWPYFVGDNKPYRDHNFSTGISGASFDVQRPVNDSPNNTGLRELPPAQPAFIWYPYAESPEFPITGTGGRNAMAGPVFYSDLFDNGENTFPSYFDGKLFIYDWMRGWVLVVTMDARGDVARLEPFMPSVRWSNAIDMAFDENGELYVLEYGTGWYEQNADARLNRVTYDTGNRPPVARIRSDATVGAAPMTVRFSAAGSSDPDDDALTYSWSVGGEEVSRSDEPTFVRTFDEAGVYTVMLAVRDDSGLSSTDEMDVRVGNTPPRIEFEITGNRSFYWDRRSVSYTVRVTDPETGRVDSTAIDADAVYVAFDYAQRGFDSDMLAEGHQLNEDHDGAFLEGRRLIDESDCEACHSTTARSIGPSYVDVALRYRDQEGAVGLLAAKIIQGGGGVWSEQAMAAHPQLSMDEASEMVEYILSLAGEGPGRAGLPLSGRLMTDEHMADTTTGTYALRVRYTDDGAVGADPVTSNAMLLLRHPRVQAESYDLAEGLDAGHGSAQAPGLVKNVYDGSYIAFSALDLTDIDSVRYGLVTSPLHSSGGRIDLRLDGPDGVLVSSTEVRPDSSRFGPMEISASVEATEGEHDVYFVFRNEKGVTPEALFLLDWIEFRTSRRSDGDAS